MSDQAPRAVPADAGSGTPGTPPTAAASADVTPAPRAVRRFVEDKIPRGLAIRVFVYVVATHFVAGFLYLLFVVGGRNQ